MEKAQVIENQLFAPCFVANKFATTVVSDGIEPSYQASETYILSVVLRDRDIVRTNSPCYERKVILFSFIFATLILNFKK